MKTRTFLFALSTAFLFSACHLLDDLQVEKRHYGKGYYVHLRKDRQAEPVAAAPEENAVAAPATVEEKPAAAGENAPRNEPPAATSAPASQKSSSIEKTTAPVDTPPQHSVVADAPSSSPVVIHENPGPSDDGDAAVALLLLVILAILLPPLAVALKEGLTVRFFLDLIFWLLGYGFIIFVAGGYIYLGIFGLIAIIYALLIVLDVI